MANNSAPSGWNVRKREEARHAMGVPVVIKGLSTSTTAITATGLLATDIIVGVVNLSDPTEDQVAAASFTPTANTVTCATESLTNAEHYLVIAWRAQADDR